MYLLNYAMDVVSNSTAYIYLHMSSFLLNVSVSLFRAKLHHAGALNELEFCLHSTCFMNCKLETVSIAEPLQNRQHVQNPKCCQK